jgi:hypothetical protein
MKSTDDLFQLVKSMSKSEKGYFKKFATRHTIGEKNSYIRLFDAIDEIDIYDELLIKQKLKGERFADKLYSIKNYLFNLILKSLSAYHSEKYAVSKLHMMMIELNVLFEKGLYKQFRTLLNKAINIAAENDKLYYLALLYNKAMTSIATDYYSSDDFNFDKLKKDTQDNIRKISRNEEYHILYNEMFFFSKNTGTVRNEADLEKLNAIVSNPLLKDESFAETFDAKFKYFNIMGHYYRIINDNDNWLKFRKSLVKLMESDKKYIRENPRSYILALNNYLHACVFTKYYDDFFTSLKKLKQFAKQFENKKEYADIQSRTFLLVSDLELSYAIKNLRLSTLDVIISEIERGFKKAGDIINENRRVNIYNRLAYACFLIKDYDKSIGYINKIMNAANPRLEPEQHSFARLRSLIVHFEAGNYDLLEYTVKSTKRFLQKTNRIFKFEKLILDFIIKAMDYRNDEERTGLYEKLLYDINKISNDKFEKNALEHFDVISWINSKLQNKKMVEILKKKAV